MDHAKFLEIMERFEKSELTRLHWKTEHEELILEKAPPTLPPTQAAAPAAVATPAPAPAPTAVPAPAPAEPATQAAFCASISPDLVSLRAPLVGTFYSASEPGADPYVSEGDQVAQGEIVGIIEAMKMMNYLEAPVSGTIVRIAAQSGKLLGFDELILEIEPCDV